ncbi:hypothetical protein DM02DRAFT_287044 [Periconia macrospinosa]|uniref:Uncharacterized protein n=1 Tax=Periconia macrospinosa TaxID=97972 RepID=A0A2V1ECB8_9PLEO|nr:hypothetical protein DM02DRAFT_287044 [Periconia macrospinosa]
MELCLPGYCTNQNHVAVGDAEGMQYDVEDHDDQAGHHGHCLSNLEGGSHRVPGCISSPSPPSCPHLLTPIELAAARMRKSAMASDPQWSQNRRQRQERGRSSGRSSGQRGQRGQVARQAPEARAAARGAGARGSRNRSRQLKMPVWSSGERKSGHHSMQVSKLIYDN